MRQRELRKNMPLPEVILWQQLRRQQLGVRFRRQYAVDGYILDFYCPCLKIGIEVDGESHYESKRARLGDRVRDKKLNEKGIKVLRFLNTEVMKNIEGVLMRINEEIERLGEPPLDLPLVKGEKTGEREPPLDLPLGKGERRSRGGKVE